MTHVLSDANLLLGELPAAWEPALCRLRELDELVAEPKPDGGPSAAQRATALQLRAALLAELGALQEHLPPHLHPDAPEFRRTFTEAVLLFCSFAEAGGQLLIDTVGEPTLAGYPLDFAPGDAERAHVHRALMKMYGMSAGELDAIENNLERITSNLRVKAAIGRALAALVRARGAGDAKRGARELMRDVYGALPWQDGDVDVVLSTAAVFLCVPYSGSGLVCAGYAERPEAERAAIGAFLERIAAAQSSLKSVRFPAFGLFDESDMSPAFMPELVRAVRAEEGLAGVHERVIADTFKTMVTVLPTHDLAKFLVHDAYGHGWQETLCEFEWTFQDMPRLVEPLHATGSSFCSGGERWVDAFEVRAGRSQLRPAELERIATAELRGRIRVGVNLVIAECLADLIEHKLARHGTPLPSSSLLPSCPLRLDLSIMDTRSMVRAWRRPYRALSKQPERERLAAELAAAGLPEDGLVEALEEARSLLEARFAHAFDDRSDVRAAGEGRVGASILQRVVLGVAGFDAAVERFLDEAYTRRAADPDVPRYLCPAACVDLLVLLLAWFYEHERALHVWHLDELLHSAFMPALLQLEAALHDAL